MATSSALWRTLGYVGALEQDYSLIIVDVRGHGRSERPLDGRGYETALIAADVVAVLDAFGVERAHYFGDSLGGRVGFAFAASAPQRCASLIIGGGSHWAETAALSRGQTTTSSKQASPPPTYRRAPASRLGRTVEESGVSERSLAKIRLPVLLLANERDEMRMADSYTVAAQIQDVELAIIRGENRVSAVMNVEQVLRYVKPFLARANAQIQV
jgi:pimeloyl-ACP methyl ester carboxylesterase